jgi:hypothetical protein
LPFKCDLQRYTAEINYAYVHAEDFAVDVTRHLEFKGNTKDARDLHDASIAATAGGSAALAYVTDRNGDASRAVELSGAGTVAFAGGLRDAAAWSLCAWVKPAARAADPAKVAGGVLYSERADAVTALTASGTINALGVAADTGALTFAGIAASAGTAGADGPRLAPEVGLCTLNQVDP